MSHELRTPLNSLLILAHQLSENPEGNLSGKQVKFARTIHAAGTDLMGLINDILDLSKIESGTVTIEIDEVLFSDLREFVDRTFRHVADEKGLDFRIEIAEDLPMLLATDSKRLRQVIKNLLSNAFKFTERGMVSLGIRRVASGWTAEHPTLDAAGSVIAMTVEDTGIGIPSEKQRLIFEAFQQADGSTGRKYGGTGLGLSISREIARLLGGEITLRSQSGEGSAFTLFIPDEHPSLASRSRSLPARLLPEAERVNGSPPALPRAAFDLLDDVATIEATDLVLLIVENESGFARILMDLAHEAGLKAVVASRGDAALALARRFRPAAVTLDLRLPDMSGEQVLESIKGNAETCDIPVHVISGVTEGHDRILELGAASYWLKPVDRPALQQLLAQVRSSRDRRRLVVVDHKDSTSIAGLVEVKDMTVESYRSGAEALAAIDGTRIGCIVLPPDLADMTAEEFTARLATTPRASKTPVLVYSERPLAKRRVTRLRQAARDNPFHIVDHPDRVREELGAIIGPRVPMAPEIRRPQVRADASDLARLEGKRVFVVDDDVRNIFALTSLLERYKIDVLYADNGATAISMLKSTPGVDIVLMDIMMPGMDGFDVMREIRSHARFKQLPIIALTARAMKGDREKCIEAGASDYVPKPVAPDELLTVLCAWAQAGQPLGAGETAGA
jgi:CheY-like chemotaxis protein/two-component sensor histidine kinase